MTYEKRVHVCGETRCTICEKYVPPNHLCYVQPAKPFTPKKPFFLEGLSKLLQTFNLEDASKGYFPHFFDKIEKSQYVGSIPSADMYGCDDMTVDERRKFFDLYTPLSQAQKYIFDFRAELLKYCSRDVYILRLACLKFRESFLNENSVDPFRQSVNGHMAMERGL